METSAKSMHWKKGSADAMRLTREETATEKGANLLTFFSGIAL